MRSVILTLDGAVADRALPIVRETAAATARASSSCTSARRERAQRPGRALRAEGIEADVETHPGSPDGAAEIVAEVARRREGGLIVVATGRPPKAEDTPSPGLTRRLLRAAPCPVVAVPAAA